MIGSLVLYRGPGDPRFARNDEHRLASVLPAFAAALQCHGPAVADNRHASPGAHRLLLMAEGGASREALSKPLDLLAGRLLPMLLVRLREQARRPLRAVGEPAPSITHETPAGQFVVSASLLRALDPGHEPLAQVTLQRLEPHAVALQRALRALPLTAGQRAVCRELVDGHSQADIGTRLGVGTATVVDHVRKAYLALNVRSVLELRALVDQRMGRV